MVEEQVFRIVIAILLLMVILCTVVLLYTALFRTARIYNWNGERYCYLGCCRVRKADGDFVLRIGERMLDLSYTTVYRICPGRAFCRKNRFRNLFVYADGSREHLVIEEEPMKTEIPF